MSENTISRKASKKGSNKTPKQRQYIARDSRALKRSIETFKGLYKVDRLTASQLNALAYFLVPISAGSSES